MIKRIEMTAFFSNIYRSYSSRTRMCPGAKTDLRSLILNLSVICISKVSLVSNKELLTQYVSLEPASCNTASEEEVALVLHSR